MVGSLPQASGVISVHPKGDSDILLKDDADDDDDDADDDDDDADDDDDDTNYV